MSQMDPCANCGNYEFEDEDGVLVCTQCGRQQEGGLQVADEVGDFGTQGKISRKTVEKTKVKVTKIYRGAKAYKLYLQAWQHILWKQAYALIHGSAKAPSGLWTVIRDLWTLRLSRLTTRLESSVTAIPTAEDSAGVTSVNETTFDSASEGDQFAPSHRPSFSPTLWDTVSHIYLSTLLLRVPISLSQIYRMIRTEEVPFIRAIRHVPDEMTSRLPPEYQRALDTAIIPTMIELQQAVHHLVQSFSQDFGLEMPPLNWRILLFEWIQRLALPIEVYPAVKQLAGLTRFEFAYDFGSVKPQGGTERRTKPRRTPVAWPETQLISLIVVATKLVLPFPTPSYTRNTTATPIKQTFSSLRLDWPIWLTLHQNHLNSQTRHQPLAPGKEVEIHDTDILNMSDDAIDAYMDWYQHTFTTPDSILVTKKTELEMSILDMFPLPSIPPRTNEATRDTNRTGELLRMMQSEAILPTASGTSDQAEGDSVSENEYTIFPTVESLEATSTFFGGEAEKNPVLYFHEKAAEAACIDLKCLVSAVRYSERRLETWVETKRREEVFGEEEIE